MFARRYFGGRYFARRYWAGGAGAVVEGEPFADRFAVRGVYDSAMAVRGRYDVTIAIRGVS